MKKLIKRINIDRDFCFSGQRADLNLILKNTQGIRYQFNAHNELKFSPKISWGVLNVIGTEINVRALLTGLDSGKIKINFRTSIRPEHFFLIVLFAIPFFTLDLTIWGVLGLVGLWIIFHLWFHFIYRYQENKVIDNIIEKLKLKQM